MGNTVDQALWYPRSMLVELQSLAEVQGTTMAWIVHETWTHAKAEVALLDGRSPWRAEKVFDQQYADIEKLKHTLALSSVMMTEVKHEAARLDRSMSWLVVRAWCVAGDRLRHSKSAITGA